MDDVVCRLICPDYYDEVIRHLRFNFFSDEPLNKSLSLCEPGQPHEELEEFSLEILRQGISFAAIVETTGEVAGVLLNGVRPEKNDSQNEDRPCKDRKLRKIFDFLEGVDRDVDFLARFNAGAILELKILSVDYKFRGRGIAARLYEITEEIARSKGFELLRADATGLFSQKLFEKNGFSTLKEISYDEYPSRDSPPFFRVEPPHVSFKLMVKKLK